MPSSMLLRPTVSTPNISDCLRVDVFLHPDEFPPDVTQFLARFEIKNIEFSVTWYRNFVNTVYPGHEGVRFYVLRRLGLPVAVLPVVAKKSLLSQKVESLGNFYTSCYTPLFEDGLKVSDLVHLLKTVFGFHFPLASMRFAPMDPKSDSYQTLIAALQSAGLVPFRFFCFGNWYLPINDDWPTYLKNREGAVRSTLKRMTKKFAADGGTLELVREGVDLARSLVAYESVYSNSWKVAEPYPQFIPGLMQSCSERGWLRLGVAWLNDSPIASQLWIVANGKASIFKLAYDEAFKAYAPGTLLTAMLMENSIEEDRVVEVDYLIGDDPYKKAWMSHRRERWGIVAYNPKNVVGFIELIREASGRILKAGASHFKSSIARFSKIENR
jgi:hypothetical protein